MAAKIRKPCHTGLLFQRVLASQLWGVGCVCVSRHPTEATELSTAFLFRIALGREGESVAAPMMHHLLS